MVTKIKAILKTQIQKLEKPIFLFSRTNKAAVRNSKILAALNVDLCAAIGNKKSAQ